MDGPRYPQFAAKLASARVRTGKSQEKLAAEVGTSRRHYIRWENGQHLPSPVFLTRLGEALGRPEEFEPDDVEAASMTAATAASLADALQALVRTEVRQALTAERAA